MGSLITTSSNDPFTPLNFFVEIYNKTKRKIMFFAKTEDCPKNSNIVVGEYRSDGPRPVTDVILSLLGKDN